MKKRQQIIERLTITPGRKKVSLKKFDTGWTAHIKDRKVAQKLLKKGIKDLSDLQEKLYAQDTYSVLIIFQAMDAAGKDGTIRHVMSGVNPQGCQVYSFKAPSLEELDHTYLWRAYHAMPERGRIGIHNRSHYEEVLIARVHPEILANQHLPKAIKAHKHLWKQRFAQINDFERNLSENGVVIIKFFLNVSKDEQKRRFLERIENPSKNWKFSMTDTTERAYWDDYMKAYEEVFEHTSTAWAPWHVIPADNKWFMRLAVSEVINRRLETLDLHFPILDDAKMRDLAVAKEALRHER
jgi:PPK2 family polyphosphate:nucleotide phosphotransferase